MTFWLLLLSCFAAEGPKQPVAFSHKHHAGALKLSCKTCHSNPAPGEMMTFAAEKVCMSCHSAIKTESPDIQKVAKFFAEQKRLPWVRVYQVPTFIFWSHKSHLDAGATCADCHGDVREMEVMYKAKGVAMGDCMDCHRQRKAPNDCSFCHERLN